ncbi:60 kDa chaperonin 1 [Frankliniella fusca]|uniref:60 kDa chaperonin 1 n=1 Tax=Frankliniella fusca TaxID=407009 RepID=A0AAE1LSG9_9NEOP|nr:60 kDa chaperonin 1 [Frankliniella fusca]
MQTIHNVARTASLFCVLFAGVWAAAAAASSSDCSEEYSDFGCDADKSNLLADGIREAFWALSEGEPLDELPPMDPVRMTDILFCRGYGPVRANIQFPYSTLAGVSAVNHVSAVRCSGGDTTLTFTTHHEVIVQEGLYNLTGSFGDVFAVGKGNAHIVLRDVTIRHQLRWRRARDGLRVRDYRGAVSPGDMTVRYENLRSEGRDVLEEECRRHEHAGGGEIRHGRWHRSTRRKRRKQKRRSKRRIVDVNKYFNEHWRTLYDALSQSVDFAFSAVFRDYMDALLRRIEDLVVECDGRGRLDD